jgi:hypothetical protein
MSDDQIKLAIQALEDIAFNLKKIFEAQIQIRDSVQDLPSDLLRSVEKLHREVRSSEPEYSGRSSLRVPA